MNDFLPYITNDNSVGLYDKEVDDIYHSASGALSEAFEKFILPIDFNALKRNKNINVLDICYGIGYNTKAFLSNFFKQDYESYFNINIDCVDMNLPLMKLSPFISTKVSLFSKIINKSKIYKNVSSHQKAIDILNKSKSNMTNKYSIPDYVNLILLKNLIKQYKNEILSDDIKNILLDKSKKIYFNHFISNFIKNSDLFGVQLHQTKNKSPFVHNIYYENISKQYNIYKNIEKNNDISIHFIENDVRNVLLSSKKQYDVIFLDGFTPAKCPCIWSEEFFSQLYDLISNDGLLLTYNMSAPVRHAIINARFYIGNNILNNNCIGTIATKNKLLIKNSLSEKQLGLLNTKAGITYKDNNLCNLNNDIIQRREEEVKLSILESSSKYLKRFKNEI